MENFRLNREIAQLVVLQRIELIGPVLKNLRKLFGRYIFSNFISKYLISVPKISKSYFLLMQSEYSIIEKYLDNNQNILSIGSGIGGLELLICKKLNNHISFIERNYVSKKVRYGWDDANKEAYNSLYLSKKFLLDNNLNKNNFNLYDYDKDIFPRKRFDLIISLYSLDYHYNFDILANTLIGYH